jgi:hypothetical protein
MNTKSDGTDCLFSRYPLMAAMAPTSKSSGTGGGPAQNSGSITAEFDLPGGLVQSVCDEERIGLYAAQAEAIAETAVAIGAAHAKFALAIRKLVPQK